MRIIREKDILQHSDEFAHYGVLGMKWGVRRATYKNRSVSSLRKSKINIQKENVDTSKKSAKYAKKSAKYDYKAHKNLVKNNVDKYRDLKVKSAKFELKAKKGKNLIAKNNKLINLYDIRIKQLQETKGK